MCIIVLVPGVHSNKNYDVKFIILDFSLQIQCD